MDVARFCNNYPGLDLEYKVEDADNIMSEDNVTLSLISKEN